MPGGRSSWNLGGGRVPAVGVFVLLVHLRGVHRYLLAFYRHGKAIHSPGGTAGDEIALGRVLGFVLGTLEPGVLGQPLERGTLMRAGQVESVDRPLPADQDDFLFTVD